MDIGENTKIRLGVVLTLAGFFATLVSIIVSYSVSEQATASMFAAKVDTLEKQYVQASQDQRRQDDKLEKLTTDMGRVLGILEQMNRERRK